MNTWASLMNLKSKHNVIDIFILHIGNQTLGEKRDLIHSFPPPPHCGIIVYPSI